MKILGKADGLAQQPKLQTAIVLVLALITLLVFSYLQYRLEIHSYRGQIPYRNMNQRRQ